MDPSIHLRWHFSVPIYEVLLTGFVARNDAILRNVLALRESGEGVVRGDEGWRSGDQLHRTEDPHLGC